MSESTKPYRWEIIGSRISLRQHGKASNLYELEELEDAMKMVEKNKSTYFTDEAFQAHLNMFKEGYSILKIHLGNI